MDNLNEIKKGINLVFFASSYQYVIDVKESSKNSVVARHANGDKVVISRTAEGNWVYFSVRDELDNGTIIDFIQRRKPYATLGQVRRELRAWNGSVNQTESKIYDLKPVSKDRANVLVNWSRMEVISAHRYLESRGIRAEFLSSQRLAGTVLVDDRNNAIFPHMDDDGICGYEIKNRGFTGFAPGGIKSLWLSNRQDSDTTIVVTESAIDALSHAVLKPANNAFYASTAGGWSDTTRERLRSVASSLPQDGRVVLAFDQDEQGRKYVESGTELLADLGRELVVDLPPVEGNDWNDILMTKVKSPAVVPQNRLQKHKERI